MTDDRADLVERIEHLEAEVADLRETVADQERTIALLAADAGLEAAEKPCPECGTGKLYRRSGMTWAKIACRNCNTEWRL